MAVTYCSPNRLREKVSLRRWYLRKAMREREREREVKEYCGKASSPSTLRISWETRVAGPERGRRQLPGNVIRKRPGGQVVWGFASESECWAFNCSDRGNHWRVWAKRFLWSGLHFHRIIWFHFNTESRHRVQCGSRGTIYEAFYHTSEG